ncbi:MAG: Mini-ribonuclease 3 [Leptolyngbyaceae cyanobacterium]
MTQFSTDPSVAAGDGQLWSSLVGATALSANQVRSLSPLALAYVGDAVYELHMRRCLLMPPKQIRAYHRQVVDQVRAEQQAHYLGCLKPHLTDDELDVVRRGRNAAANRKTRASLQDYQQATALEALIGYLYLTDPQRLTEVLAHLPFTPELA